MTGTIGRMRKTLRSWGRRMGEDARRQLRALIPPMTPRVIFRALLGVLLFLCGIVYGAWIIIRHRRHSQGSTP